MKKAARKEDPIILACAGVLALGIGGWVAMSAMGFKEEIGKAELDPLRAEEAGETPAGLALVKTSELKAVTDAGNFPKWSTKEAAKKERGFLVSTPLVYKAGAGAGNVIDLDKPEMLRPPLPNSWLTRYRLQSNYANVTKLDPDGDGFTNEEEYLWGLELGQEFDPTDSTSHPPYYYKLIFDKQVSDSYVVEFKRVAAPNDFQFKHVDSLDRQEAWTTYMNRGKPDKPFPDRKNKAQNRFKLENLTETEPYTATVVDSSREDGHPKAKADIVEGEVFDFGDLYALMGYAKVSGKGLKLELLQDSDATFSGLESYRIRLLEVSADRATIQFTDKTNQESKTLIFERGEAIKPKQN